MAFKLGQRVWQCTLRSMQNTSIPKRSIIVPPNTGEPTRTNQEVIYDLTRAIIGGPNTYDPVKYQQRRLELMKLLPSSQDELPNRKMSDSFDHAIIPLGQDLTLRDKYINPYGGVRMGRLLEDMDVFAVHLVFKHVLNPKSPPGDAQSPFSIVTALVDRIHVRERITATEDIKISGHVTWVGRSSAESTLNLHQLRDGIWKKVISATFVMVAKDPLNEGNGVVNRLVTESPEEKRLYNLGQENYIIRKNQSKDSLFKSPPNPEENQLIHDFFIQTVDDTKLSFKARIKPENSIWMEDSKLKNLVICQPENRNRFNKIFGGFIMRQAFELAWANAYVYSKEMPIIEFMDDILFQKPVEIGSLLYFNSQVCYTQDKYVQIRVSAEVVNPKTGQLSVTNVFQYTFSFLNSITPSKIIPKTYHEAMLYLDGRRHFLRSTENN